MMLAVFSFLSKILGFVRESLIAAKYGSGSSTDAFFLALTTIGMFNAVVSSSIGTTLIPILSEVEKDEGKEGKQRHLNNFLNIIALVSLVMVVIAFVFAPQFLRILAAGFDEESFKLVTFLSRVGTPTIFFSALIGVYKGYLESEGMFKVTGLSAFLTNIILILFLTTLAGRFDVRALMVVYVIAQAAPLVPQLISLKSKNYHYTFVVDIKDKYMAKVLKMIPPILLGVAISDINAMADNSMASTLAVGSVSSLQYARRIDSITMGIFITSIMTVIFPLLSSEANKEDKTSFKNVITQGTNIILMITIPAMFGMIVLGTPIIRLAFERGKFTSSDTIMAAGALTFYAIGMTASALKQFISRAFYSLQDTKTPTINSAITVVINIALNFILIGSLQHRGLALATSLANIITVFILLYFLRKKIGPFGVKSMLTVLVKSTIASLVMGVVAYYSYVFIVSAMGSGSLALMVSLMGSVILAVIVYFVLLLILKIDELNLFMGQIKKKLKKA